MQEILKNDGIQALKGPDDKKNLSPGGHGSMSRPVC